MVEKQEGGGLDREGSERGGERDGMRVLRRQGVMKEMD